MHRALSSCHNSVKPVPHEPSFGTLYSKASLTLSHKPRDFSRWALPPVTALTNNESFLRLCRLFRKRSFYFEPQNLHSARASPTPGSCKDSKSLALGASIEVAVTPLCSSILPTTPSDHVSATHLYTVTGPIPIINPSKPLQVPHSVKYNTRQPLHRETWMAEGSSTSRVNRSGSPTIVSYTTTCTAYHFQACTIFHGSHSIFMQLLHGTFVCQDSRPDAVDKL